MIFSRPRNSAYKRAIPLSENAIEFLNSAVDFRQELLSLIKSAKKRIYITALYLQDDEAGREVLDALYEAKQNNPMLDVCVFVDFHRAQRGLIGETESLGNRQVYLDYSDKYEHDIKIYGVAVKARELLGVLHLKGFVFDDVLLFSGASINDVYLHKQEKYRCDRYHKIQNKDLSDCFVNFLQTVFVGNESAPILNQDVVPSKKQIKALSRTFKALLRNSKYRVSGVTSADSDLNVVPLVGLGARGNRLNAAARKTFRSATDNLVIFTPYFNFPKALITDLKSALKKGVKVTIVVGDKKANDFYIAEPDEFSTIGIVPYVYEMLLSKFIKGYKSYIDSGQLNVHLWRDGDNSYHLKGVVADDTYHLITGSNLNPRAWSLDLENGLFVSDHKQVLKDQWHKELASILKHTQRVNGLEDLEAIADYPDKPRELLRKIKITQIDRILKRLL